MVRRIDGDERRRVLAEAVWSVIRRDGFDGASVRAVAAEASLSTGSVRHFFATQDQLHLFAMEALLSLMTTRVAALLDSARPAAGWTATSARRAAESVLAELLPLTREREELFLVHLQFIVKATVHPVLAPMARRVSDELAGLVEHLVRSLVDIGGARADLDVPSAARDLTTLLDGITLRRLTAPERVSSDDAVRMVGECLDGWAT